MSSPRETPPISTPAPDAAKGSSTAAPGEGGGPMPSEDSASIKHNATLWIAVGVRDRARILTERPEIAGSLLLVWSELLLLAFRRRSLTIEASDSYVGKATGLHRQTVLSMRRALVRLNLCRCTIKRDSNNSYEPVLWTINPSVSPCRTEGQGDVEPKDQGLSNDPIQSDRQKETGCGASSAHAGRCAPRRRGARWGRPSASAVYLSYQSSTTHRQHTNQTKSKNKSRPEDGTPSVGHPPRERGPLPLGRLRPAAAIGVVGRGSTCGAYLRLHDLRSRRSRL
jgi:hypothetical protein